MKRIFSEMKSLRYALLAFAATALLLGGCSGGGGSDYDAPQPIATAPLDGQPQSNLVDVATLKAWVDGGLVNSDGLQNVVIIDCRAAADYLAGHIPGAQLWPAAAGENRYEGPILTGNMVYTGEKMDEYLQSLGVTENTTIVLDGTNGTQDRVYFMLRYWGFPKSQLKRLDGGVDAWKKEYTTEPIATDAVDSKFSVADLKENFDPNVRASLSEVIAHVEEGTAHVINTYPATASDTVPLAAVVDGTKKVIFNGLIDGAVTIEPKEYYETVDGVKQLKSPEALRALLESRGIDGSKPIITYCRAGNLASQGFAPLEYVLGWNVMVYDGSWSQWGSLTNNTDTTQVPAGYALPAPFSEWANDFLTNPIYWNRPNVTEDKAIEKPTWSSSVVPLSPYDEGANTIEDEDREYAPAGYATDGVSGGGGGGC